MQLKKEGSLLLLAGLIIGVIASLLVYFGNPANMGFCIACFLRDTAGGLGLHQAAAVQYVRPEILGLALGAFLMAVVRKEFNPRGGSSPLTRFIIGFFVMIGCLMFLGCPFRTILRLAGGDLNAIFGLVGYVLGILVGVFFLNKGFSLKRSYRQGVAEGGLFTFFVLALLLVLAFVPSILHFTQAGKGPGGSHALLLVSLGAGLVVGGLAQLTRMCMVGGVRDLVLLKEWRLLGGFIAVLVGALLTNLALTSFTAGTFFKLGFLEQPIAHTDGLWNALGMMLAGLGSVMLGGCPMRQLVMSGEGSGDSAVTILGLLTGAAFAHNFGLASSAKGPTFHGQIAVVFGLVLLLVIASLNTFKKADA